MPTVMEKLLEPMLKATKPAQPQVCDQGSTNLSAFLAVLRYCEHNGNFTQDVYTVINGGCTFSNFADHPRRKCKGGISTAAGAYQIKKSTFDGWKLVLGVKDFSPKSQDAIAIGLIDYCGALADVKAGRFNKAIQKCRYRPGYKGQWSSLPGGTESNVSLATCKQIYEDNGGTITA